jgi:hypothetical protein
VFKELKEPEQLITKIFFKIEERKTPKDLKPW